MAITASTQDSNEYEAMLDELEPGATLLYGQYTIERFLNSGGFGLTYLARDSLSRQVVIKECFPGSFCHRHGTSVGVRSRAYQNEFRSVVKLFIREAWSLSKLRHPHIVGVHQVFEDNDTAYMALDFVNGYDLLQSMDDAGKKLSPVRIRIILEKILGAVGFVHSQNMLHRDISPDNILLYDTTGEPVLIDFGAAREKVSKPNVVLSEMRVVKDGYSPQEFYVNGSKETPASDLYALGATFYHLITGEAPPVSQVRLLAIASQQPDPYVALDSTTKGYDPAFLGAINKALEILPRDRLQSAQEWLDLIVPATDRSGKSGVVTEIRLAKPSASAMAKREDSGGTETGGDRAKPSASSDASGRNAGKKSLLLVTLAGIAVVAAIGIAATQTGVLGDTEIEQPVVAAAPTVPASAPEAPVSEEAAPVQTVYVLQPTEPEVAPARQPDTLEVAAVKPEPAGQPDTLEVADVEPESTEQADIPEVAAVDPEPTELAGQTEAATLEPDVPDLSSGDTLAVLQPETTLPEGVELIAPASSASENTSDTRPESEFLPTETAAEPQPDADVSGSAGERVAAAPAALETPDAAAGSGADQDPAAVATQTAAVESSMPVATSPARLSTELAMATISESRAVRMPILHDGGISNVIAGLADGAPDWMTVGHRIVDINRTPMRGFADIPELLAGDIEAAVAAGDLELEVLFGVEAFPGADIVRKAAVLPIVPEISVAGGLAFQLVETDQGTRPVVSSVAADTETELQVGDLVTLYLRGDDKIEADADFKTVLLQEIALGVRRFNFTVERDDGIWLASFRLDMNN